MLIKVNYAVIHKKGAPYERLLLLIVVRSNY
jgi:hypothetical protein